jgi:hypothetical protein
VKTNKGETMRMTLQEIEDNENGYAFNDESDGLYALIKGDWVKVEVEE